MKVFIVSSGLDNQDCQPTIRKVFFTYIEAKLFVKEDIVKELARDVPWASRLCQEGPKRWSIEVYLDTSLGWTEDEVWLIEEYEVHQ